jgi:predicted DNA-binding protein (UPF0251 family)
MTELSPAIVQRSRKINALVLQSLADLKQNNVAALMGVDGSTVTRIKDERIAQMALFLAACGLKVVRESANVYDESYIAALKKLAGIGLEAPPVLDRGAE